MLLFSFSEKLSTRSFSWKFVLIFLLSKLGDLFFFWYYLYTSIVVFFYFLFLTSSLQGYISFINFVLKINFWLFILCSVFCLLFCSLLSLPCYLAFCLFLMYCSGCALYVDWHAGVMVILSSFCFSYIKWFWTALYMELF